MDSPSDDLARHAAIYIARFPGQTEIGNLQLALTTDQQVVRFEITMEDPPRMAKVQAAKTHGHPTLDIPGLEDERLVFDDRFEVGIQIFQYQREGLGFRVRSKQSDNIGMRELSQELDLPDGGDVDTILECSCLDLFDGN